MKTTSIQKLIQESPDLVDRIFDYILKDSALAEALQKCSEREEKSVDDIKKAVRQEFAGEHAYVRHRRDKGEVSREVLRLFNGVNATQVARKLGISRASVYRHIKQAGK